MVQNQHLHLTALSFIPFLIVLLYGTAQYTLLWPRKTIEPPPTARLGPSRRLRCRLSLLLLLALHGSNGICQHTAGMRDRHAFSDRIWDKRIGQAGTNNMFLPAHMAKAYSVDVNHLHIKLRALMEHSKSVARGRGHV